jgi:type I restriction enzyme S subunit
MERNPGLKQTELGTIPVDWEIKQIRDLKPFVTSGSRGAEFYAEYGALFVRITNLSRSSIYLELDDNRFVRVQSTGLRSFRYFAAHSGPCGWHP